VGSPYVYGGSSPKGFDCSGFTSYIYRQFGINLSRSSVAQLDNGTPVAMSELMPGDLVFFSSNRHYITHVGLYLGDGEFIHASNPTRGVVIDTLWSGYYKSHYWSACRIITE
jgi:cell wall-associated NlpC family hydrolase